MNVYHYCSLDVFKKIISGGSLRLSDISKSNDSLEIEWITKDIKEIFLKSYSDEKTMYFMTSFPIVLFEEMIDFCINKYFNSDNKLYHFFVCCFSENGDLLSQWRGYADDGKGIAIGFDKNIFQNIEITFQSDSTKEKFIKFDKVVYNRKNQQRFLMKYANKLIDDIKDEIKMFSKANNIKMASLDINDAKKIGQKLFNESFLELFKESVFHKNDFFIEEAEWRICRYLKVNGEESSITSNDKVTFSEINYFERDNLNIPYIVLNFNKVKSNLISEVILGPKCNSSKDEIHEFLKFNGINCVVDKSEGSYR